jgi:hypothetical protein
MPCVFFWNNANDLPFSLIKGKFLEVLKSHHLGKAKDKMQSLLSRHDNTKCFCPVKFAHCGLLLDLHDEHGWGWILISETMGVLLLNFFKRLALLAILKPSLIASL